jgi:hypothetical protein
MDQADDLGAQPRVVSRVERRLPLADGAAEGGDILHPIFRRLPIGFLLRSSNRSANALPIRTIEKPPPKMMRVGITARLRKGRAATIRAAVVKKSLDRASKSDQNG